jgi:sec-independent protein translocase protein TatA
MPSWIRGPEIIIILVIVVLIFGVGRIDKILKELGKGIREFKREVKGENQDTPDNTDDEK